MLRRVALVRTEVSEERSASFIRVTRIGELETTLAVSSNRLTLRRNGISILTRTIRRNVPEDTILHSHRRENLKSYLSELLSDERLESTFNSMNNNEFWMRIKYKYPHFHERARRFLPCFSTTYFYETAFLVTAFKTKKRGACNFLTVSVWLSVPFVPDLRS
jgi:hypothetical protein